MEGKAAPARPMHRTADAPVVAVPVRSFWGAYRRLADAFGPERRADLARALASRTAGAAASAGAPPVIVASAPEVRDWAEAEGYEAVDELFGGGLDGAARAAVRRAAGRPWLILHADLPCLTPEEVGGALDLLRAGRRVLAPSYDGGTSALGGCGPFPFSYGPASFHRHLHAGPPPAVLCSLGFALDVDRPPDLEAAARHPRGAWLRNFLRSGAGGRVG